MPCGRCATTCGATPATFLLIDNEDYVAPRDFAREVRRSGLAAYVYRGAPGPRWPTLRQMAWRRQQVVVLAEHDSGDVPWYTRRTTGDPAGTPYTFDAPRSSPTRRSGPRAAARTAEARPARCSS